MTAPETLTEIQLAPDYYLRNFRFLIDHVIEQYADLLSQAESDFHQCFARLPTDAQKLYVRMLMRKGSIFRAAKLRYKEIAHADQAASALRDAGLIHINPVIDTGNLAVLFNKNEWLEILEPIKQYSSYLPILKKLRRAEFDQLLVQLLLDTDAIKLIGEDIYQLAYPEIFNTYRLLFFGNLTQDLTEFILSDLGLFRYESYRIDKSARLFTCREQIEKHLRYYALGELLEDCLAAGSEFILELYRLFPEPDPEDKVLVRRIQKVSLKMARQLERLDCIDEALDIYRHCQLPPARERRSRIYAKKNRFSDALAICGEIIEAPANEAELSFAQNFGQRIARKCNQTWRSPSAYQPGSETLVLDRDIPVELAVANYFSPNGECHYVENALFCSLFGLHYWELIFAPVRGAFSHPFQARPHDLYEPDFLHARHDLFEIAQRRLENFSDNARYFLDLWQSKHGTVSPFVYWGALNETIILTALQRIPVSHWQCVFERLWQDIKANSSGFPDLVYFPSSSGYELIEVKGPGDRLQQNQLRWMRYFADHNIPHRVIQVEWRER